MKNLFLVRHAKAQPAEPLMDDAKRALSERGLNDAQEMSTRFKQRFKTPEAWFCSPAQRAVQTSEIFAKNLNWNADKIKPEIDLYSFNKEIVRQLIERTDDAVGSAIFFFHNPTMEELIIHYTDERVHVPTCAIVLIQFEVDQWEALHANSGVIKFVDFPRNKKL